MEQLICCRVTGPPAIVLRDNCKPGRAKHYGRLGSQTDQLFFDSRMKPNQKTMTHSGVNDDRWVFTNKDTGLEYLVSAALAASSRSLRGFDDQLADECLKTAGKTWDFEQNHEPVIQRNAYVPGNTKVQEIIATAELLYTTGEENMHRIC